MKKLAIIITAALLALMICAAALANDTAVELFDKTRDLLFNTENVTLKVNAEFALDGTWFKTVDGTWKQDGERSFRQLLLTSPKADGSERKNGYTIVTEAEKLYLMEVYTPGIYRKGFSAARKSIIRNTVESSTLCGLAGALVSQADLLLGERAVTRTAEGDYLLKLDDNAPKMANAVLNQVARFAAKRYFGMDYDLMRMDSALSINSFPTLTEGILYTMQEVSFRQAEIAVKTDAEGRLQHAEGTVGLYVNTALDGWKQLDVTFRADVSDIGSTVVKAFDPVEYEVTEARDEEAVFADYGSEISEDMPAVNGALIDEIELKAMEIWAETGFNMTSTTSVGCSMEGDKYVVTLEGGDSIAKKAWFTQDGKFVSIYTEPSEWLNADSALYTQDPEPDAETDRKAKEFMKEFLEKVSPETLSTVKDLKMQWIYEKDGAVYAQYHEDPLDQEGDGVLLVVRISPGMRIEYFSCVSNG